MNMMDMILRRLYRKHVAPEPKFVVCAGKREFRQICKKYGWKLGWGSFISIDDFVKHEKKIAMRLLGRRAEDIWHSGYCENAKDRMPQREYDLIRYSTVRRRILTNNNTPQVNTKFSPDIE